MVHTFSTADGIYHDGDSVNCIECDYPGIYDSSFLRTQCVAWDFAPEQLGWQPPTEINVYALDKQVSNLAKIEVSKSKAVYHIHDNAGENLGVITWTAEKWDFEVSQPFGKHVSYSTNVPIRTVPHLLVDLKRMGLILNAINREIA